MNLVSRAISKMQKTCIITIVKIIREIQCRFLEKLCSQIAATHLEINIQQNFLLESA